VVRGTPHPQARDNDDTSMNNFLQNKLIRAVGQMSRKRDPNAPKDLTDEQRQMLCRDPHLTNLRR